jgi:hypothetical protein
VKASAIAVSVVNEESLAELPRELQALVSDFGSGANVWVGGAAALGLDAASLPHGCHLVRDQLELERRLDTIRH